MFPDCVSASDHWPSQASASSAPPLLTASAIKARLTLWSRALLESMPDFMQHELLMSRVDGVFNFSQVLFYFESDAPMIPFLVASYSWIVFTREYLEQYFCNGTSVIYSTSRSQGIV